jgi:hypothetical protein
MEKTFNSKHGTILRQDIEYVFNNDITPSGTFAQVPNVSETALSAFIRFVNIQQHDSRLATLHGI